MQSLWIFWIKRVRWRLLEYTNQVFHLVAIKLFTAICLCKVLFRWVFFFFSWLVGEMNVGVTCKETVVLRDTKKYWNHDRFWKYLGSSNFFRCMGESLNEWGGICQFLECFPYSWTPYLEWHSFCLVSKLWSEPNLLIHCPWFLKTRFIVMLVCLLVMGGLIMCFSVSWLWRHLI